jgi:peroxiredoxin
MIYVLAAAIAGALIFFGYFKTGGGQHGIGPASLSGSQAQSFEAATLGGGTSSLAAYRGHIVVMNLWASWCPPCRAEMPDLERFWNAYKKKNIVVIGVNQGESAERAGAFAQSLRIHFPILLDQDQAYGRVYAALGLPTTIVIDPSGMVARGFDGELTYSQMVAAVTPLLSKH